MMDTAPATLDGPARTRQILAVIAVSTAILLTGFTPYAVAGLLIAFIIVTTLIWRERPRWASVGVRRPASWPRTIAVALLVGIGLQLFSIALLAPLLRSLGSQPLDLSHFDALRGDPLLLAMMLVYVWIFVALVEEIIFRGFLLPRIAALAAPGVNGMLVGIASTAVIFGLAHSYQGPPGIFLTTLSGVILGTLFVRSGLNLWTPILAHGVLDTFGLLIFYTKADEWLPSVL